MKLLRNPEFKNSIVLLGSMTAGISVVGFLFGFSYGIVLFVTGILYSAIYVLLTARRYKAMEKICLDIDTILQGGRRVHIADYREGELSILQDELGKLTGQLMEQADNLKKDKVFLADSIADISHQIKTPLTSINLIVSFISEPGISQERRQELISELVKLLARIDWLIGSLLKMSKLDAGTANLKKETVFTKELIDRISTTLAIPMEIREQTLNVIQDEKASYQGDISWSAEAMGNIVKNCMEHTPAGGQITIRVAQNPMYTEFVISDSGSGIDAEDLPHLFKRFYRGRNASENSIGIGLALARMIIVEQNGTIKAENGTNGGAVFTIKFYRGAV